MQFKSNRKSFKRFRQSIMKMNNAPIQTLTCLYNICYLSLLKLHDHDRFLVIA